MAPEHSQPSRALEHGWDMSIISSSCYWTHRLDVLIKDLPWRVLMPKLILPGLTFMLLPEAGDFQGGKEIGQSLESWVLVPALKLSSCVNSIITLLQ